MRRPCTELYLHCVWATYDRLPFITPEIESRLYASIVEKCRGLNCEVIAVGGYVDHVHLLVRFPTTLAVASLIKEIKGASSHLITHEVSPTEPFKWQGSYGAFTAGKGGLPQLIEYVKDQKAHHTHRDTIEYMERCEDTGREQCESAP